MTRVLIVSWEYPPLIEGGLARHVRKLSEALVARDIEVHVLTRGGEESTVEEQIGGVQIHRIVEPERPTDLAEFVTWVERMNSDMLAAGVELGDRIDFDLVHGHDWLVAGACDHLARRFKAPLVTTIHATEYGRHQGWVDKHPQSHIHGVEKWMANRSDRVIACSSFMRDQIADIFSVEESRITVIPNGIDPEDLPAGDPAELAELRSQFGALGQQPGPADRPPRLREGLPARPGGDAQGDRGGSEHTLPGGRRVPTRPSSTSRPRNSDSWSTAPSSAGSVTTCSIRSTGSPT